QQPVDAAEVSRRHALPAQYGPQLRLAVRVRESGGFRKGDQGRHEHPDVGTWSPTVLPDPRLVRVPQPTADFVEVGSALFKESYGQPEPGPPLKWLRQVRPDHKVFTGP